MSKAKTINYRKIWKSHYGPIPVDHKNRPYHIHHIDGNRENNDIANLQCVSISEHYEIHKRQGDWAAAAFLASKMKLDFDTISELSRRTQQDLIDNNKHHWQNRGGDDETIYSFENIASGEIVLMTQFEFRNKYNLSPCDVGQLIHNRRKIAHGWKMAGADISREPSKKGKDHAWYDPTIYHFENIRTSAVISLPKLDFALSQNISSQSINNMVNDNPRFRTVKGWRILGTTHGTLIFHTFKNSNTGEQVTMTQRDFWKTYELNKSHVSQMVRGKKGYDTIKGWVIVR